MGPASRVAQMGRPVGSVLLALPVAVGLVIGCAKRPEPELPATPVVATVRLESLVREHPAYPELARLRQLSAATSPLVTRRDSTAAARKSREKAETSPLQTDSNRKTPGSAPPALSEGERTAAEIAEDARAMKQEHERFREAQAPSAARGGPPVPHERLSPSRGATDVRLPRGQLASILRRETVDACRLIGVEHGIELRLPPDVPEEATDMTGSFRTWLRAYWKTAEPGAEAREGVTRQW